MEKDSGTSLVDHRKTPRVGFLYMLCTSGLKMGLWRPGGKRFGLKRKQVRGNKSGLFAQRRIGSLNYPHAWSERENGGRKRYLREQIIC